MRYRVLVESTRWRKRSKKRLDNSFIVVVEADDLRHAGARALLRNPSPPPILIQKSYF